MDSNLCPCGSQISLSNCCLPIIQGTRKAETAVDLLRARYTAFTRGDVDFIFDSHHSKTRDQVKREEIEEWSGKSEWRGLQILETEAGKAPDQTGTIAFIAEYRYNQKNEKHGEKSYFEKEGGVWKFLDAHSLQAQPVRRLEPKVGRNDACPCGSGKKYKKCCSA